MAMYRGVRRCLSLLYGLQGFSKVLCHLSRICTEKFVNTVPLDSTMPKQHWLRKLMFGQSPMNVAMNVVKDPGNVLEINTFTIS